jgi:hypothetical protein
VLVLQNVCSTIFLNSLCLQHHYNVLLAVLYTVCTTMTNGGTGIVPPLVMELQTGSTNNHISQIFFVLAAPMSWWYWLAAPVIMVQL